MAGLLTPGYWQANYWAGNYWPWDKPYWAMQGDKAVKLIRVALAGRRPAATMASLKPGVDP